MCLPSAHAKPHEHADTHYIAYGMSSGTRGVKRIPGHRNWGLALPLLSDFLFRPRVSWWFSSSLMPVCLLLWPFQSYTYKMRFLPFRNVPFESGPYNLEDTFPALREFFSFHPQMPIETRYAWFLLPPSLPSLPSCILLPHCFFIVIPHLSSHSTSDIRPRFQFVVWPFPSYIRSYKCK